MIGIYCYHLQVYLKRSSAWISQNVSIWDRSCVAAEDFVGPSLWKRGAGIEPKRLQREVKGAFLDYAQLSYVVIRSKQVEEGFHRYIGSFISGWFPNMNRQFIVQGRLDRVSGSGYFGSERFGLFPIQSWLVKLLLSLIFQVIRKRSLWSMSHIQFDTLSEKRNETNSGWMISPGTNY